MGKRTAVTEPFISPEPHDKERGILTATVSGRGTYPQRWVTSEHWAWILNDPYSFIQLNVAYNLAHHNVVFRRDRHGHLHSRQKVGIDPLRKLRLENTIGAIQDLAELSTHISPEMYAKIERKGLEAIMVALRRNDRTLDKVLIKLQQTLRKAVDRES
jgi:hypothetical protein